MTIDTDGGRDQVDLQPAELGPIDEFRMQHRTAVLVILFTDLKGSTELAEQKGELYSQQIRHKHDEMLREIVHRGGAGKCIKNIGDSLMCIFAEPTAAVARAVEIQQKLLEYNRAHPDETPMEVRIGMHMGQVVMEGDVEVDVFGRHVNRAARIESLAAGGQILLTSPVYDSANGWLNEEKLQWADHGRYLLKGIKEPTRVYEVCAPGSKPNRPTGKRAPEANRMAWAVVLAAATIVLAAVWLFRPANSALEARLHVHIKRGDQLYLSLNEALPLRTKDRLQLVGELSRPAHASIVWLDSIGQVHVVANSKAEKVTQIAFPPDADDWVDLEGQPGVEILMLVTSAAQPTNTEDFAQLVQSSGPFPALEQPGAIWLLADKIDSITAPLTEADKRQRALLAKLGGATRAPGKITTETSAAPEYRADKLRQLLREKSTDFHAVAVSHL